MCIVQCFCCASYIVQCFWCTSYIVRCFCCNSYIVHCFCGTSYIVSVVHRTLFLLYRVVIIFTHKFAKPIFLNKIRPSHIISNYDKNSCFINYTSHYYFCFNFTFLIYIIFRTQSDPSYPVFIVCIKKKNSYHVIIVSEVRRKAGI